MDELVKAAMAKWPNVPACYGWLGLDERGRWWMRDDAAQQAGPFAGPDSTPESRGSLLQHDKLIAFIERNYAVDDNGCGYFQNGPQRVYVELAVTPWVWRLEPDGSVRKPSGQAVTVERVLMDESGRAYLATDAGLGLVHTADMWQLAQWLEEGSGVKLPPVESCDSASLPGQWGYVTSPVQWRGAPMQ